MSKYIMKILSFIYVCALFIVLTPNVFISYDIQFGSMLHNTLFIIIFYFTYDRICKEGLHESMENTNVEFEMNGLSNLATLFGNNREETDTTTVVIDNTIRKPQ